MGESPVITKGVPASVVVRCLNTLCPRHDQKQSVELSRVAPGVAAWPTRLVCEACSHDLWVD